MALSLVCSLSVVLATPARVPAAPAADRGGYERVLREEAYWISTAQLSCAGPGNGAIAEAAVRGPGAVSVHPYEANLGAQALLLADPRYLPMVRGYLEWYLRTLNRPDRNGVTGTVYDYDYDPRTCVGTPQPHPGTGERPKYDSTDAYAGTFLSLVAAYARADPAGHDFLRAPAVRADLEAVADVIGATRRPSGLSGATPTYPAEYLMDNVEAQRGIEDYGWLLRTVLDDPAGAQRRFAEAAAIRAAIETHLWAASRTPGMYAFAADRPSPSWDTWFPDSVAQLWPVWAGVGDPGRRRALWAAFARRWPEWVRSTPAYGTVAPEHDPNAGVAYAAATVGDRAAVDEYLRNTEERWVKRGRPPPWTVDDAGFRALAAATMAASLGDP